MHLFEAGTRHLGLQVRKFTPGEGDPTSPRGDPAWTRGFLCTWTRPTDLPAWRPVGPGLAVLLPVWAASFLPHMLHSSAVFGLERPARALAFSFPSPVSLAPPGSRVPPAWLILAHPCRSLRHRVSYDRKGSNRSQQPHMLSFVQEVTVPVPAGLVGSAG